MRTARSTTTAGRCIALAALVAGLLVGCSTSNEVTASRRSESRPAVDDGPTAGEEFPADEFAAGEFPDGQFPGGKDVPCPSGELAVEVTSIEATDEFDTGTWMVELAGTLENGTDAPVTGVFVDVRVDGAMDAMGFTDDFEIAAGATTTWTASTIVLDGPEPSDAEAIIDSWMWADFDHFDCPTN